MGPEGGSKVGHEGVQKGGPERVQEVSRKGPNWVQMGSTRGPDWGGGGGDCFVPTPCWQFHDQE